MSCDRQTNAASSAGVQFVSEFLRGKPPLSLAMNPDALGQCSRHHLSPSPGEGVGGVGVIAFLRLCARNQTLHASHPGMTVTSGAMSKAVSTGQAGPASLIFPVEGLEPQYALNIAHPRALCDEISLSIQMDDNLLFCQLDEVMITP